MKKIIYPLACGLLMLATGCQDSYSDQRRPATKEVVHDKAVPVPIPVPIPVPVDEGYRHHHYHHHHHYYHNDDRAHPPHHEHHH